MKNLKKDNWFYKRKKVIEIEEENIKLKEIFAYWYTFKVEYGTLLLYHI